MRNDKYFNFLNDEPKRFDWFIEHVRNSHTGAITIKLDDKNTKSFKKVEQAAKWLTETEVTWLLKNTDWYHSFLSELVEGSNATSAMVGLLIETLAAKRDKAEQIRRDSPETLLSVKDYVKVITLPEQEHNQMDRMFLSDLVYCDENDQFYITTDGSYVMLGGDDFMKNGSNVAYQFIEMQRKRLAEELYKVPDGRFELWKHIQLVEKIATDTFFDFKDRLSEAKQNDVWPDEEIKFFDKKYKNLREFESVEKLYSRDAEDDMWVSTLSAVVTKYVVNNLLPATLFSRNLLQVKKCIANGIFCHYSFLPPVKQCTLKEFYIELFDTGVKSLVPHIKNIPHICSETCAPAKYHLNADWMNTLTDQKPLEECKALNTFLSLYTEDEKTMLMAWAYSVFHPSIKNNMALLIKTGGCAFKTNVYERLIETILKRMYGNVVYTVIRDNWVKNEQLCESSTIGFSSAELIFNDECTENCIIKFKEMSGSTSEDGVSYTFKKVYQVPVNTRLFAKFLFCTNEAFTITDAQGVYDRRLAIIDRMDIKNLPYPYGPEEWEREVLRETKAFYELSETYYNKLKETYCTVENFAKKSSISKNLRKVYNEEAKQFAYDELLSELDAMGDTDDVQISDVHGRKQYNVTSKVIKMLVEKIAPDMDLNPKGFRKFLLEVDTEFKNDGPKKIKINGFNKYGYILHERK